MSVDSESWGHGVGVPLRSEDPLAEIFSLEYLRLRELGSVGGRTHLGCERQGVGTFRLRRFDRLVSRRFGVCHVEGIWGPAG